MRRFSVVATVTTVLFLTAGQSRAVELLVSGDFEFPETVEEVPHWILVESITGSVDPVNAAEVTGGGDPQLFIRAFAGGGPLNTGQGNFDNNGLPAGSVDGADFLTWQRNNGLLGTALPEQGDATGDMNVDGADLAIWQSNYGASNAGTLINVSLSQTVPGLEGDTYTFQGTSTFEEAYSGLVSTLGDVSPHGQITSPTLTQFKLEFLDSGGAVIGTPTTLDLRDDYEGNDPGFPLVHSPLVAQAPTGTTDVRVVAEALDIAWNGSSDQENPGTFQSAFFNDFSLTRSGAVGTELLENGDLNLGTPDALDFWNQVENPIERDQILRAGTGQAFSNHTPGGSRGVWLSAFFGAHPNFEPDPVDGRISQTVQALEGGTYTFSGWMKFEQNYSGGVDVIADDSGFLANQESPTQSLIRLEFLDIDLDVIETFEIDVKEERQAACPGGDANSQTCGPAADGWLQHTLQGIAPVGTEFARLTAIMEDGVFNTDPQQSAFWDDFSLDGPSPQVLASNAAVPEPTSVALLALGWAAIGLRRGTRLSSMRR